MPKTVSELREIAKLGGGISVDATSKTARELRDIANATNAADTTLIIRNADSKTPLELREIAKLAPGKVIFEV